MNRNDKYFKVQQVFEISRIFQHRFCRAGIFSGGGDFVWEDFAVGNFVGWDFVVDPYRWQQDFYRGSTTYRKGFPGLSMTNGGSENLENHKKNIEIK